MRAGVAKGRGGVEVLAIEDVSCPEPGPNQILVKVCAAALNYADTMQRRGEYQVPPGQSDIMGVEIAGIVEDWGSDVRGVQKSQRVFGLVEGGGYAEYCLIEQQLAMDIPETWSFTQAAAVTEVFFAADETLFELGNLQKGESVLIHAGGSGVGSAAIQMAHSIGAKVFCTVGSEDKAHKACSIGADIAIQYKRQDFVKEIMHHTRGEGVDVIEDFIGGSYLSRNLSVLKPGGCLILVGLLDGYTCEIDLTRIILGRLQIKGTAIRSRPLQEKVKIRQRFEERWLPLLVEGVIHPIIHSVYPLEEVALAHQEMEAKRNFGKIVLTMS